MCHSRKVAMNQRWTMYVTRGSLGNWGFGLDYYREYEDMPKQLLARIFVINLIFFRITINRWEEYKWM
jgi:hypothetical protein